MQLVSHVELVLLPGVDVLVEVRVGVRLFLELAAVVLLEVGIQEADVPAVHLYPLVDLPDSRIVEVDRQSVNSLGVVVYRPAVSERVVVVVAELLQPGEPVEGPDLVVVSCVLKGSRVFFHKDLPASDHSLQSIHCGQVAIIRIGPAHIVGPAVDHRLLGLLEGADSKLQEQLVPFLDELVLLLSDNKVVLVGQVPARLGVGILVDSPVKGSAFERVKLHHDLWVLAEAIEDEVGWLLRHLHKPVEAFEPDVRDVHVDAAVSVNQGQTDVIRSDLRLHWKLGLPDRLVDSRDLALRKVVL